MSTTKKKKHKRIKIKEKMQCHSCCEDKSSRNDRYHYLSALFCRVSIP